jgi:hypothetical protein
VEDNPITSDPTVISGLGVGLYQLVITDGSGCKLLIENLSIGKDGDFVQAINHYVSTYVNQSVKSYLVIDEYSHSGSAMTAKVISGPHHGSLSPIPTIIDTFLYTPNTNFVGKDSVKYVLQNACGYTDTAYIYITVLPLTPSNRPIA